MIKVIFCPEGHHVSDDNTLAYVDSVFWEYDFGGRMDIEVKVGNKLIVDCFLLRLLEKKFPANEIEFYDNKTKLRFDEQYGLLSASEVHDTMGMHANITRQISKLLRANMRGETGK